MVFLRCPRNNMVNNITTSIILTRIGNKVGGCLGGAFTNQVNIMSESTRQYLALYVFTEVRRAAVSERHGAQPAYDWAVWKRPSRKLPVTEYSSGSQLVHMDPLNEPCHNNRYRCWWWFIDAEVVHVVTGHFQKHKSGNESKFTRTVTFIRGR